MTASLFEKYKIPSGQHTHPLNTLSFILRKAELGKRLTNSEWEWLNSQNLPETSELILSQETYRDSLELEIKRELRELRQNKFIYSSFKFPTIPAIDSEAAFVFYKVHNLEDLSAGEGDFVGKGYKHFILISRIKTKYGFVEDAPLDENFSKILNKIDLKFSLAASELEWLFGHRVFSVLKVLSAHFANLCDKHQTDIQQLDDSAKFQLYVILQKLEELCILSPEEYLFLKTNEFSEPFVLAQKIEFSVLKEKYLATQFEDDNPAQHLFKVLKKLEAGLPLPETDLNFLRKRKLSQTIKIAFKPHADLLINKINRGHGLRPDDMDWCRQHDFSEIIFFSLKKDYGVEHRDDSPDSKLYFILEKLEKNERLTDDDKTWLAIELWCRPNQSYQKRGKWENIIFLKYHNNEALFYEAEFQRTKNQRNLVEASSHWRKAEQPKKALDQTSNIELIRTLKDNDLKAALFTTRGGALRDIGQLDDSEKYALEAKTYNPKKHYPYTLLGALCYDTKRYDQGDKWFEEAVKRGAKTNDQDTEIRRILNKKKDKDRQEMINHLLAKDPTRFAWAKKISKE